MIKILSSISRNHSIHDGQNKVEKLRKMAIATGNNQLTKCSSICIFVIIALVILEQSIKCYPNSFSYCASTEVFYLIFFSLWFDCGGRVLSRCSECCDMNVLFLSVSVAVFDCAACVCVLMFFFLSLLYPCCHSSSRKKTVILGCDTILTRL